MSNGTFGWQGETLEFPAGVDSTRAAGVSPLGRARLRYNDISKELEVSLDGAAYQVLSTGSDSPWVEVAGTVRLQNSAWNVVIGAAAMVGSEKLRVVGDTRMDGSLSFPAPATSSYHAGQIQVANVPPPNNQVFSFGWNINADGNQLVAGEASIYDSWESNFLSGAIRFSERHWQYISSDGLTRRRPLTMVIDRATHASQVEVGGKFAVTDQTHTTPRVVVLEAAAGVATATIFGDATAANTIRFQRNNTLAITQIDTTGTVYIPLINLDGTDSVVVGGAFNAHIKMQSNGGAVPPLKTTAQRDAIVGAAAGEWISNSNQNNAHNVFYSGIGAGATPAWKRVAVSSYGGLSFANLAVAFAPGAGMTPVTAFNTLQPEFDVAGSLASDNAVVAHQGDYKIFAQLTFLGEAGDVYDMAVFVNGVQSALLAGVQGGVAFQTMSLCGVLTLAAGAVVDLRMQATGGGTIEMRHGQLTIDRVN